MEFSNRHRSSQPLAIELWVGLPWSPFRSCRLFWSAAGFLRRCDAPHPDHRLWLGGRCCS